MVILTFQQTLSIELSTEMLIYHTFSLILSLIFPVRVLQIKIIIIFCRFQNINFFSLFFQLPQVAIGSSYLSKTIGVTNPIHRSKITLKAMDVVLFGPPKEVFNTWKDVVFTSLLLLAVSCLFMAYRQNKRSQVRPIQSINH